MPRKKNTEAAEVKTEVVAEAVKKPEVEVVTEKPAEKPAKKAAAKKPAAPRAKAEPKHVVKVQFRGEEYDLDAIKTAVDADLKSKVKGRIKTVEIYVKPEDKAVYYVVNSDFSDKVEL